jgi:IclR family transcriptional regulator, pca regulon regulatory protein
MTALTVSRAARFPKSSLKPTKSTARGRGSREAESGGEFVQGIDRGFKVIRSFGSDWNHRSIAEVAGLTGLTRAVARRYLFTLVKLGYVTQSESDFALAPRILDLGYTYLSTLKIPRVAPPFMNELVEKLHESCSISLLDGSDIVYVSRKEADRIMSINLVVGSRLPAYATSMGKVLLAYRSARQLNAYLAAKPLRALTDRTVTNTAEFRKMIARVREQGWAITDGDLEEGIRSVAAPIFDGSPEAVAAINISVHADRVSVQELKKVHLPALLETAARISEALQAYPATQKSVEAAALPTARPKQARFKADRARS